MLVLGHSLFRSLLRPNCSLFCLHRSPHCSLCSRAPLHSLVCSLTRFWARGTVELSCPSFKVSWFTVLCRFLLSFYCITRRAWSAPRLWFRTSIALGTSWYIEKKLWNCSLDGRSTNQPINQSNDTRTGDIHSDNNGSRIDLLVTNSICLDEGHIH